MVIRDVQIKTSQMLFEWLTAPFPILSRSPSSGVELPRHGSWEHRVTLTLGETVWWFVTKMKTFIFTTH